MSLNNQNNPYAVVVPLGSLTTDATLLPAFCVPKHATLLSAKLMNGADVAASDSNYFQVSLKKGSTVVAEMDSRAAHENGVTANTAKSLNLVSGEEVLAEGSNLSVLYNETGTMALTNAVLVLSLANH